MMIGCRHSFSRVLSLLSMGLAAVKFAAPVLFLNRGSSSLRGNKNEPSSPDFLGQRRADSIPARSPAFRKNVGRVFRATPGLPPL